MVTQRRSNPGAGTQEERRKPGRPRNTEIDQRIIDAATAVYGERGWAGFNFDVVARRADISKDAIYRRYSSPMQLLLASWGSARSAQEALRYEESVPPDADLRAYLLAVAKDHFVTYTRENRFEHLRVYIESKHNPELLEAFHLDRSSPSAIRVRRMVRKAMEAGILPLVSSPTAMLDAIVGGIAMHVMATPPDLFPKMIRQGEKYLIELVDIALRGAGYDFASQVTIADLRARGTARRVPDPQ